MWTGLRVEQTGVTFAVFGIYRFLIVDDEMMGDLLVARLFVHCGICMQRK